MPKPDPTTMKARELEAYLSGKILEYFGNDAQDQSSVTSSYGTYYINLQLNGVGMHFSFKKKSVPLVLEKLRALR